MLAHQQLVENRLQNTFQSVLIIAFMAALLGFCSYLILGEGAFYGIFLTTLLILSFRPKMPTWLVMKLYRASPLSYQDAPELSQIVERLAQRARLTTTPSLYYVPSSSLNAFTTGNSDDSAIAITDGLLRTLSLRELAGVLAHEVSHIVNHDLRVMSLADTMSRLTALLSQMGLIILLLTIPLWLLGLIHISLLAVLIMIAAPIISSVLQASLSRTREFAADLGAAELTGDPYGLASALIKIDNPYAGWWQRIFMPQGGESGPSSLRTHPPTEERITRLKSLITKELSSNEAATPQSTASTPVVNYIVVTRRPRRHWSGLWY